MSKHTADTATAVISPKVKSAGVWGAVVTGVLVVAAAFLQSVPREALEQLGPWAGPVGAAIATAAAVLAAYAKGDPLRNLGGATADMGGIGGDDVVTEAPPVVAPVVVDEAPIGETPDDTSDIEALEARLAEIQRTGSSTVGGAI